MSDELQEVISTNPEWYRDLQYEDVKGFIQDNINNTCRSFVAIGYYLKYIRDKDMYLEDGYQNIWELAQSEFGISKSQASKFMSINDRFSKDGNSPVLVDKYKDFSSSKLSEMLYLTDEQLEQVTPVTTVAEIREIRKPEEVVSTSKQEPVKDEAKYIDKLAAYWCKREITVELYELAKSDNDEDIDVFNQYFKEKYIHDGYAPAHNTPGYEISFRTDVEYGVRFDDIEKTGYSWLLLMELVCQEAENETPASKPNNFHENENGLKRLKEIRKEIRAKSNSQNLPEIVNDVDETVIKTEEFVINEPESETEENSCSNCRYNTMSRDEYFSENPDTKEFPCDPCGALDNWEPMEQERENTREAMKCDTCGYDEEGQCEYPSHDIEDQCLIGEKWTPKEETSEPFETVEADILQTDPFIYHDWNVISLLSDHKKNLKEYFDAGMPRNLIQKHKIYVDALELLSEEIQRMPVTEEPEQVQPELPVLKNNDQRKEWAENYKAWGEWYYDEHIDCHYYKYDFPNGDRLVVDEYRDRERYWDAGKKDEQFYHLLLKEKQAYGGRRTYQEKFSHQTSSMSEIVEHLKNAQKK